MSQQYSVWTRVCSLVCIHFSNLFGTPRLSGKNFEIQLLVDEVLREKNYNY